MGAKKRFRKESPQLKTHFFKENNIKGYAPFRPTGAKLRNYVDSTSCVNDAF